MDASVAAGIDEGGGRRRRLGESLLVLMGYALLGVWLASTEPGRFASGDDAALVFRMCSLVLDALTLVAAACLHRRIGTLRRRPTLMGAACALAVVGTLGQQFAPWASGAGTESGVALAAVCGSCLGIARGAAILAWLEAFSALSMRRVCILFPGATILGSLAEIAVGALPAGLATVAALLACGVVGLLLAPLVGDGDGPAASGDGAEVPPDKWSFPLQPVVLMALFTFGWALILNGTAPLPEGLPSVANELVCGYLLQATVLVAALVAFDKLKVQVLYVLALAFMCAALVGSISAFDAPTADGALCRFLGWFSFRSFSLFTYLLFFSISFRYGVSPLWLFGFSRAARVVATIAAEGLWRAACTSSLAFAADMCFALALVALVVAAAVFSAGSVGATWGIRPVAQNPEETGGQVRLTLEEVCSRAAYLNGLTKREEEVLTLLARGFTVPQVEEALTVSYNTARVHVQHVYKKLGVHSREELAALVDGMR